MPHLTFMHIWEEYLTQNTFFSLPFKACVAATKVELGPEEAPKFMRKGQVGDWKNRFTPQLVQKFEAWEAKGLENCTMKFTFEPPGL